MGRLYKFYQPKKPVKKMSEVEFEEFYLEYNKRKMMLLRRLSGAQNHRCAYCGTVTWIDEEDRNGLDDGLQASFDHYIPVSEGGNDKLSNFVMACRDCNSLRGTMKAEKFFQRITDPNYVYHVAPRNRKSKRKEFRFMCFLVVAMRYFPEELEKLIEEIGPDKVIQFGKPPRGTAYAYKLNHIRSRSVALAA